MATISDAFIEQELQAARDAFDPKRTSKLALTYELTPAQSLLVAKDLEMISLAYHHLRTLEDAPGEPDPDEELAQFQHTVSALRIRGGARWEVDLDGHARLARGQEASGFHSAMEFFRTWQEGSIQLIAPELLLPWPNAAARAAALELVDESLRSYPSQLEGEEQLVSMLVKAVQQARQLPAEDDAAFAQLQDQVRRASKAIPHPVYVEPDRDDEEDPDANQDAYVGHLLEQLLSMSCGALSNPPQLDEIFQARVECGYARHALGHHLSQFYARYMADFDELLTVDETTEVRRASRVIHELIDAAVSGLLKQPLPPAR